MKKLIIYILPLILAVSLSGCYTQFETLYRGQNYGDDGYGYAPNGDESAYTEGYRSGWTDYSLYAFRDYNYNPYWSDYYGSFYSPFYQPYGYLGFDYSYNPYFSLGFGFLNFGYAPYGWYSGPYPYPYNYYGMGFYGYGNYYPYYHRYYAYNYYEVPNSGTNIYRHPRPRSFGVQPASGGSGSYGYSRPERGTTYRSSSGNSGRSTQGTYSTPRREPRSTSGSSSGSSARPERAPRTGGQSAPSSRGGSSSGGSRPDRGGHHQILFNNPGTTGAGSETPRANGRNYYRPSRGNGDQQSSATVRNGYSFHSLIAPDRSSARSSNNNSRINRTREAQTLQNNRTSGYNFPRSYQRSARNTNTYYYHPSYNYNRNSGYVRSYQSSNNRSTYTVHRQTFNNSFSSPRFDRAPRFNRSDFNSHQSSSGSRPRRH